MSKTIQQKVTFKGATAKQLYNLYMNAKLHSEVTGAPAEISKKAGEAFKVHGGQIKGKNLHVLANKMVVQTWRAKGWDRKQPDSVLTLSFQDTEDGAQVQMVHALVPDDQLASLKKGWNDHYWKLWKAYFKARAA